MVELALDLTTVSASELKDFALERSLSSSTSVLDEDRGGCGASRLPSRLTGGSCGGARSVGESDVPTVAEEEEEDDDCCMIVC